MNLLKLNDGWRSMLRQTRAAELRHDVTVLSQTFERQLDGLDSIVKVTRRSESLYVNMFESRCLTSCLLVLQNLERDLQEAERQEAQVRRVHLQNLGRLRAQQDKRLTVLQQQWEEGLQHLTSRFNCERSV